MSNIDFTDRVAVEESYPLGSFVQFNDLSKEVGSIFGYLKYGSDIILKVAPVDSREIIWTWHPGNVTRVRQVRQWEPIE